MLTQKRLKKLLHYNPDTGIFVWMLDRPGLVRKGDLAGTLDSYGYVQIGVDGKSYRAYRLAWLYMEGYWPENEVDHINRIRNDDRWRNLREVSHLCNSRNRNLQKNNTSGITGVYRNVARNKWCATIKIKGRAKNLGYYVEFDEAVCARLAAEQCLGWEGCHRDSSAFQHVRKITCDA